MKKETYNWSNDYKELVRLMKAGVNVPCLIGGSGRYHTAKKTQRFYEVQSTGTHSPIIVSDSDIFTSICNDRNVRFIDPASQIKGKCGECASYQKHLDHCMLNWETSNSRSYCSMFTKDEEQKESDVKS